MKAKERHDIKTDKFLETVALIQEFLIDHGRTILLATGIALAVGVVWLLLAWFLDFRETSAATALKEAMEKFRAVEAAGLNAKPEDIDQALDAMRGVVDSHGMTAGAVIAHFHLGLLYLAKDDPVNAKAAFQAVFDCRHPLFWTLAAERLGDLHLKEGNTQAACDVFRAAADELAARGSSSAGQPPAYFAYRAGLCFETLGDRDQALAYFSKARNSDSQLIGSPLSTKIERKIRDLGGAVAVPSEQGL